MYLDDLDDVGNLDPRKPKPIPVPSIAPPQMEQMKSAVNLPGISVPQPQAADATLPATNANALPAMMPTMHQAQTSTDISELNRLKNTGSGLHQFQQNHHILGGILRGLDIAGSVFLPGLAQAIPGTTAHHDLLLNQQSGMVKTDLAREKDSALASQEQAKATALAHPQATPKEEHWSITPDGTAEIEQNSGEVKPLTDPHGKPLAKKNPIHIESDQGHFLVDPDTGEARPLTFQGQPLKGKQQPKPDNLDQQYDEAVKSGNTAEAQLLLKEKKELAGAGQAPQRDPRQLAVGPDGTVIELRPGMKVPQGSKTVSGDLATGKPSADEQRRADLANNLSENLDKLEEIVKRRPDLFGPAAGRLTSAKQFIGTDDPDVASLQAIHEQTGMAMVGTHAMRNAQHVEAAANAIINAYKNDPKALLGPNGAIAAARNSLKTFQQDADRAKSGGGQAGSDTVRVQIPGHPVGTIPAKAREQFLKDHPDAKVIQ